MQTVATIDYKALYEAGELRNNALQLQVLQLKQQLSQLQKMIFGSKHERFIPSEANPAQLSLAIEAETVAACSITGTQKISYTRTDIAVEQKPLQHPGRMKLPESLRRPAHKNRAPRHDLAALRQENRELRRELDALRAKQAQTPPWTTESVTTPAGDVPARPRRRGGILGGSRA